MNHMRKVDWSMYQMKIENVASEDGGGFRIFMPTLGYAVVGVGDSLEEALTGFEHSKEAFEEFIQERPNYSIPSPTLEDLTNSAKMNAQEDCNFAYAA